MKKISKEQAARIEQLRSEYREAVSAANAAIDDAKETVRTTIAGVNEKLSELNAIIENADELRSDIESQIGDAISEKSDAWADSERGQAFAEWQQAWGEDLETVEMVEEPEMDVELPEELLPEDVYPNEPSV